jgi:polyisoprenyl-phosphate glycosyltransferase
VDGLRISVVLPVFNETDCILEVLNELTAVLEGERFEKYEVIPVDDGSTDGTFEKILQISKRKAFTTR